MGFFKGYIYTRNTGKHGEQGIVYLEDRDKYKHIRPPLYYTLSHLQVSYITSVDSKPTVTEEVVTE